MARLASKTKTGAKYPAFHQLRISHAAFVKIHEKMIEAMKEGRRETFGETASRIILETV